VTRSPAGITLRAMPPRLQAFLAVVLWGVSFVATKAALREVSPTTLIFSRSVLGTVLLFAALVARRRPLVPPRATWGPLALMGFVGVAFHQVLQAHGIRLTTAVHAAGSSG
jgi:drug/metabolite transporter (DMT)-like permease